jgi:hypothetical protein
MIWHNINKIHEIVSPIGIISELGLEKEEESKTIIGFNVKNESRISAHLITHMFLKLAMK